MARASPPDATCSSRAASSSCSCRTPTPPGARGRSPPAPPCGAASRAPPASAAWRRRRAPPRPPPPPPHPPFLSALRTSQVRGPDKNARGRCAVADSTAGSAPADHVELLELAQRVAAQAGPGEQVEAYVARGVTTQV